MSQVSTNLVAMQNLHYFLQKHGGESHPGVTALSVPYLQRENSTDFPSLVSTSLGRTHKTDLTSADALPQESRHTDVPALLPTLMQGHMLASADSRTLLPAGAEE